MNFTPGNYLIELMGRSRMVAELSVCNCGGFLAEEIDRSGNRAEPVYIGSLAIYRMWPCSEEVAVATAARLGDVAGSLPEWAVKPAPPPPEPPKPRPGFRVGDLVGILDDNCNPIVREWVGCDDEGDVARVAGSSVLKPLRAQIRWIRREGATIWERTPGQYNADTSEDIPF